MRLLKGFIMKRFVQFVYVFMLFSFLSVTHAASASADLASILNTVKSMKANFTQVVYDNHGKATQKSSGKMAMQRPGKFRWDITKPMPQLIIANETKLWIYDPDLEQVTIRSLKKAAGESPALLLSHDSASLDKDYNVKTIDRNSPEWRWFSLVSKQSGNLFESMQMGFVNNQIREMRLQDNLGHTTVIQFQNIQVNVNLSASLFTFKPSSKVDVIDETRKK